MLRKDDKVLGIYYTVSERCRANIAQCLVRALVVNYYAHVVRINDSISIKVDDWSY